MDILKPTAELLANYVNFLLSFAGQPRKCMASIVDTDSGSARVSGKLLTFSLMSVAVALVLAQIGAAIGMAEDSSPTLVVLDRIGDKMLPVAVALAVIAASIVVHLALRVAGVFSRFAGHGPFAGDIANSVNAAMGFSAFAVPLFTLMLVALRIAAERQGELSTGVFVAVVMPLSVAIWAYLIAAFAAVHKLTLFHAVYLFGATAALFVFGGKLLKAVF